MSDRGYSLDLRTRVMAAVDGGMTWEQAAEVFAVGTATVYRWKAARAATGSLAPRPHGGGRKRALTESQDQIVKQLVAAKPDRTLAELTAVVVKRVRKSVSTSAVVRCLKRLGLTLKKRPSARPRRTAKTSRGATPPTSTRSRE